jgi:hypothetical protein
MSCQTSNYFPDITKGDTFTGRKMTFYNGKDEDKTVMNLTGASVVIAFKKGAGQNAVFTFSTADNTITIPTPTNGEIFLQPRLMNYPAFNYIFDVEVTFNGGRVRTFFTNYWKICPDV